MIKRYIGRSLSAKLNLPFAIAFFFVLAGLALFAGSSRYTLRHIDEFGEQIEHITMVNQIERSTFRLILSAHHFLLTREPSFLTDFNHTLDRIDSQTAGYIEIEKGKTYEEAQQEVLLVEGIRESIQMLRTDSAELFRKFYSQGTIDGELMDRVETGGYSIERSVNEINRIHDKKIDRMLSASKQRVSFLLTLFIIFILLGFVLLLLVNIVATRYVLAPVKKLVEATKDLAAGNLRSRVDGESEDEVGYLARSFNEMAERLEAHDREHHDWSMQLEGMVRERTSSLQRAQAELKSTNDQLFKALGDIKETQENMIRTERLAALGQVASAVAHEIQNPLAGIRGTLEVVQKAQKDKPDSEILHKVLEQIDHLSNTTSRLLSFARPSIP